MIKRVVMSVCSIHNLRLFRKEQRVTKVRVNLSPSSYTKDVQESKCDHFTALLKTSDTQNQSIFKLFTHRSLALETRQKIRDKFTLNLHLRIAGPFLFDVHLMTDLLDSLCHSSEHDYHKRRGRSEAQTNRGNDEQTHLNQHLAFGRGVGSLC